MEEKQDLSGILAANIARERKRTGMTQAALAEMLGYSDKTVSKWERAEGLPDVLCLKRMADTFGVTVDSLLSAEGEQKLQQASLAGTLPDTAGQRSRINHGAIAAIAVIGVWMLAALLFLIGKFCAVDLSLAWAAALPVTALLAVIFNGLWGRRSLTFWCCSAFVTGLLFMLCYLLRGYHVWGLMWLSIPAVAIVWLGCRITRK